MNDVKACLFDLDGVVVDTARYHFLAWKQLANELQIDFNEAHNELLKGVSRMRSLDIILEIGKKTLNEDQKIALAEKKNQLYLEYILKMKKEEVLPGVKSFITELRNDNILIALGSASKNARLILQRLSLENLFDAVIDGNKVSEAKPDPEVFLRGAEELQVAPESCVVFEDAIAGVEAAKNAGMFCVGVGDETTLNMADLVIPGFENFHWTDLVRQVRVKSSKSI